MYRCTLTIDADAVNFPLRPVWVGQGSGALFIVSGVPETATACTLCLKPLGATTGWTFAGDLNETTGAWHVYIGPAYTAVLGQGSYEVAFVDDGATYWAGSGLATIRAAFVSGVVPAANQGVADVRLREVTTGLWHRVQLVADVAEPTGFRVVFETEGQPYVS